MLWHMSSRTKQRWLQIRQQYNLSKIHIFSFVFKLCDSRISLIWPIKGLEIDKETIPAYQPLLKCMLVVRYFWRNNKHKKGQDSWSYRQLSRYDSINLSDETPAYGLIFEGGQIFLVLNILHIYHRIIIKGIFIKKSTL